MPFPLIVVPPVESERWSCLGCLLHAHVLLQTDLSKGCSCVYRSGPATLILYLVS
jgi:hypothetical protein